MSAPIDLDAARLSPSRRLESIERLRHHKFDVLVVGGGVTGCGVALDAASRGLEVALVEARDFAAGTSSRSSKLIHGGLRYLELLDFGLVHEALTERGLMINKLAPHLVRPVSFIFPLRHRVWERAYVGFGIALYDVLASLRKKNRAVPLHRHLTKSGALKLFPGLRSDSLVGAIRYYDGQVDDARHTLTVARTAAAHGATLVTGARVVDLINTNNRVTGAHVKVAGSGEFDVTARTVINATGVWTDDIQAMVESDSSISVQMSKGVHIVVPHDRIEGECGIITKTPTSVLFVIPWQKHWIIGTTDTAYSGDKVEPVATDEDVAYLLHQANEILRTSLSAKDITGTYAGLRPLVSGTAGSTSKLSREHAVVRPVPGFVVVAGGKYTTYRVMAADAVEAAVIDLGRVPASRTPDIPLLGALPFSFRDTALTEAQQQHLLRRYGSLAGEVIALGESDPSLLQPLGGAPEYLRAEIVYAVTHEGARTLDDIISRRTRIAFEESEGGAAVRDEIRQLAEPFWN